MRTLIHATSLLSLSVALFGAQPALAQASPSRNETTVVCSVTRLPTGQAGRPVPPSEPATLIEVPNVPSASSLSFPPSRPPIAIPEVKIGNALTLRFSSITTTRQPGMRERLPAALRQVKVDVIDEKPRQYLRQSLTASLGTDTLNLEWFDIDTSRVPGTFVAATTGYKPVSISEPLVFTLRNELREDPAAPDVEVLCAEVRRRTFEELKKVQSASSAPVITDNVTIVAPVEQIGLNRDVITGDLNQRVTAAAPSPGPAGSPFLKRERVFRVTPTVFNDAKPLFSRANNRYYQWKEIPDREARQRFIESTFDCALDQFCKRPLTVYLSEDGKVFGQIVPRRDIELLFEQAECGRNDLVYIDSDARAFDLAKAILFLVIEKYPVSADPQQALFDRQLLVVEVLKFARERFSMYRAQRFVEPERFVRDFVESRTLDERVRARVQEIVNSSAGGLVGVLDTASLAIHNTVNAALYVVILSWADLAYSAGSFSATALQFYATEILNFELPPSAKAFINYFEKEDLSWGRYLQNTYFPYSGNEDEVFMARANETAIGLVLLVRAVPSLVRMAGSAGKGVIDWLRGLRAVVSGSPKGAKLGPVFQAADSAEESKSIFAQLGSRSPGVPKSEAAQVPGHLRPVIPIDPRPLARRIFQSDYQSYNRLQMQFIVNRLKPVGNAIGDAVWTPTEAESLQQLEALSSQGNFWRLLPTVDDLTRFGLSWRGPRTQATLFQRFGSSPLRQAELAENARELNASHLGSLTVDFASGRAGIPPQEVSDVARKIAQLQGTKNIGVSNGLPVKTYQNATSILIDEFGFVQRASEGPIYFGLTGNEARFAGSITAQELLYILNNKALRDRVIFFRLMPPPNPMPPPGPDVTPPLVRILAPAQGATLAGSTTVRVDASDNVGVAEVAVSVDGQVLRRLNATPYEVLLESAQLVPGAHTLKAEARDAAGNSQSASISVNVPSPGDRTPPTVRIDAPAPNATVAGNVPVRITATDNVGVTEVVFQVDGNMVKVFPAPPFEFLWNTTGLAVGSHAIAAVAKDAANNRATATSSVVVSAGTVTVSVTTVSPSQGAPGTTVTINGTGFGSVSIERVQFSGPGGTLVDAASYSVDPASGGTRLFATVPAAAAGGNGPLRVKPQALTALFTTNSFQTTAPPFQAIRDWHGTNGASWSCGPSPDGRQASIARRLTSWGRTRRRWPASPRGPFFSIPTGMAGGGGLFAYLPLSAGVISASAA